MYKQGMYDKMAGKPKAKSGKYGYDKGYTPSDGTGSYAGYNMRGNDYNAIQDKIASKDASNLKRQLKNNY